MILSREAQARESMLYGGGFAAQCCGLFSAPFAILLQFLARSLSCKLLAGNFVDQVKYWLYFFFLTEQKLHQLILKELKIQNLPALILAFFFFFLET